MVTRRNTLAGLLLLGTTCLLGLLALEGVVRVLGLQSDNLTQPDRHTGWAHVSGQVATYISEDTRNRVVLNELGLVGAETTREKPAGTGRILLIGDSFTESAQVPYETNWASQVSRQLGPRWEVLNGGVSGYGTGHAALFLESRGWELQPDAVFLLFFTGNDVIDNSRSLGQKLGWQPQPYFGLSNEGELTLHDYPLPHFDTSAKARVKSWVRNRSRLYLFARDRMHRLRALRRQTDMTADRVPLTWQIYRRDTTPEWEEAWELTNQILGRIATDCRNRNVLFGVGILPTGWRVDTELTEKLRLDYPTMADTTRWDFSRPDRQLIQILEQRGIPYVNLTPVLKDVAKSGDRLYADHLTDLGHEVVATGIADFLKPLVSKTEPKGTSSP